MNCTDRLYEESRQIGIERRRAIYRSIFERVITMRYFVLIPVFILLAAGIAFGFVSLSYSAKPDSFVSQNKLACHYYSDKWLTIFKPAGKVEQEFQFATLSDCSLNWAEGYPQVVKNSEVRGTLPNGAIFYVPGGNEILITASKVSYGARQR